jgi:hypothetical protein
MTFTVTNTFVNGTTADADEVNVNFADVENEFNNNLSMFSIDQSTTDASTYTRGVGAGTVHTYTFTPLSANNIILGIYLTSEINTTNAAGGMSWYITVSNAASGAGSVTSQTAGTSSAAWVASSIMTFMGLSSSTAGDDFIAGQASYSIALVLNQAGTGGWIAGIKNIQMTIYYLDKGILTSASGKFA